MSEGQHFEIPPKSNEPQSVEDFLERGEIKTMKELEGYWGTSLVEIKDDGSALFRPDNELDLLLETKEREARRSDLELMAYKVNQILGFNLVPAVVNRTIEDSRGSLQKRVENFYDGHTEGWEDRVKPGEIMWAAIFDYILDIRDRHKGNFIIDADTDKLWLIDHDFLMFFREGLIGFGTCMIEKAQEKGLINLSGTEKASLERFLAQADSLTIGAKKEIIEIVNKAKDRVKILLEKGQIPAIET